MLKSTQLYKLVYCKVVNVQLPHFSSLILKSVMD